MSDTTGRIFGALAALAALWVIVYWWWEPSRPRISVDPSTPAAAGAASYDPTPSAITRLTSDTPSVISPSRIAVIPPRFRDYTIRKGDTFESIAQQEMGSKKYADALRSANALMDPQHPKAGRTLRIPLDPTNIQGKPVVEAPAAAPAAPVAASPPVAPPAETQATEYTVKSGDSLSAIAKAHYGSTKFKDLIFEANKDRLSSEDDVREGQKLRLPPKPR